MACPSSRGHGHEIVVELCRPLSRRCHVSCLAVRPGGVANRDTRRPASQHHGRSAEAGGKAACAKGGGKHSGVPPDICISPNIANRSTAIVNLSCAVGSARFSIGEACQAGEIQQQLQRRLRNKLQNRQCPLGRVQLLGGMVVNFLVNVYGHPYLHELRELPGDQAVPGLGALQSPVDL
jgi:hypothetical protein